MTFTGGGWGHGVGLSQWGARGMALSREAGVRKIIIKPSWPIIIRAFGWKKNIRRKMDVTDFDYELPQELIAQHPVEPRDSSRLLVMDKKRVNWNTGISTTCRNT